MNQIHLSLLLAASVSLAASPVSCIAMYGQRFPTCTVASPANYSGASSHLSLSSLSFLCHSGTVVVDVGDDAITLQRVKIGSLDESGYAMIERRRWWVCTVAAVMLLSSSFLFFFFFSPLSRLTAIV